MNILSSILILLTTIWFNAQVINSQLQKTPLFINCGLLKSTTLTSDSHVWRSDNDPAFAPPNIDTISTVVTAATFDNPLYQTARLFNSSLTYTFSISPGPSFLRLYFAKNVAYNNNNNMISPTKSYFSLQMNNNLTLLQNFNPFLNSPIESSNTSSAPYEFHINLENRTNNLNLTFYPGHDILTPNTNNNSTTSSYYGFINAIEIVPIPQGLYSNSTLQLRDVTSNQGYYTMSPLSTLQTAYRINVGGATVESLADTGEMLRTWYRDDVYLVDTGLTYAEGLTDPNPVVDYIVIPPYAAPKIVYASVRTMANDISKDNLRKNMSWSFDVDPGFDYLVRLHFCERLLNITGALERLFSVFIGGFMVEKDFDVWELSRGTDAAVYKDYVITMDGVSNGTKVPLLLSLRPSEDSTQVYNVIVSGVEILKVSLPNGSLAVPNPPSTGVNSSPAQAPNSSEGRLKHRSLLILGGAIGGLLASLIVAACLFVYRRGAIRKTTLTNTKSSSKGKQWFAISEQSSSTMTTNNPSSSPSLPSDLCRRFSFEQIRVATSDFDDTLIIGTGGFGKVYKGVIDGGETLVAIKRLHTTSKQGVHEFRTEIEMLSRLRHVHLVSLIGYTEDQGEMILVYEYMPRGTLRDHLSYKERNNNEDETLSWKQRLMICLGSARGLHYLHAGANELIIHRDVKSTNILLDDKWTAKVSDFGLSKVGPSSETGIGHVSTAVKGSFGYLDPEYFRRQQLTEKSDVFSFGVVLFEVLCARPAINPKLSKEQVNLAMWARNRYKNGILHTIVDPKLTGQIAPECLEKFGEIAESCVRDHGSERPSMGDVVWSLEFALKLQETAEKSNVDGSHQMSKIPGSMTSVDYNGDATDVDVFSDTTLGKDLSESMSVGGVDAWRPGCSTSDNTSSDSEFLRKSDSVFTEIVDPKAR